MIFTIPHGFSMNRITAGFTLFFSLGVLAAHSPRARLLLDFNWRFHLGDAADAGDKFDFPEVKDLTKTRVNEIGKGAELTADLPDPVSNNLGAGVSFVKPDFDDAGWRKLDLPHDWAVELPFNTNADL